MDGALQHYLDLLKEFGDADIDVEEFSSRYWAIRFRWRLDRIELEGAVSRTLQPFERALLSYTPDLEPDVRHVEDREIRRRATEIRRALMGKQPRLSKRAPRPRRRPRLAG